MQRWHLSLTSFTKSRSNRALAVALSSSSSSSSPSPSSSANASFASASAKNIMTMLLFVFSLFPPYFCTIASANSWHTSTILVEAAETPSCSSSSSASSLHTRRSTERNRLRLTRISKVLLLSAANSISCSACPCTTPAAPLIAFPTLPRPGRKLVIHPTNFPAFATRIIVPASIPHSLGGSICGAEFPDVVEDEEGVHILAPAALHAVSSLRRSFMASG
mmetsp:Transcript_16726/g.40037  ORF Transcript_16726/g.40037 Transcript_16726/m.40037 type:complete len:220 (+) Transcript_16726:1427-2086(+)